MHVSLADSLSFVSKVLGGVHQAQLQKTSIKIAADFTPFTLVVRSDLLLRLLRLPLLLLLLLRPASPLLYLLLPLVPRPALAPPPPPPSPPPAAPLAPVLPSSCSPP